jgi:hypothetical protein
MTSKAQGRELETQTEHPFFIKVAREPNRFESVFSLPTCKDPKGQSGSGHFGLLPPILAGSPSSKKGPKKQENRNSKNRKIGTPKTGKSKPEKTGKSNPKRVNAVPALSQIANGP